jgi:hypothetical protein
MHDSKQRERLRLEHERARQETRRMARFAILMLLAIGAALFMIATQLNRP